MKKWNTYILDFIVTTLFFGVMNYLLLPWTKLDDLSTSNGRRSFILSTIITGALFVVTWQSAFPPFLRWFKQKTKM
jgi:hypothetical protein